MNQRYLINEDGTPFEGEELVKFRADFLNVSDEARVIFRNENAEAIAKHTAKKILIVSGPGTGKSTLFKQKIGNWLYDDPGAKILALSFVRKLVADLNNDIQTDDTLSQIQKNQIEVYTLHKFARSILEKNHGSEDLPLEAHFKIIGAFWKDTIWMDVLYVSQITGKDFSIKNFDSQLHNNEFDNAEDWKKIKDSYFKLCRFYNAVGFADLIIRATHALDENPGLVEQEHFILDEYQDFNTAEELLIEQLTHDSKGLLIVGDDDQVLYDKLKSGKPSLIRNLYNDPAFVNAMLPFCGRCSYHIVKSADHFIQQEAEENSIEKVYLPLRNDPETLKVQMIGCATSATAVSYIDEFIKDHKESLSKRKEDLENNIESDAYLLILTPAKELKFYSANGAKEDLFKVVQQYKIEDKKFSDDYFKLLTYYSLGKRPYDNFSFRKALYYEGIDIKIVFEFINQCIAEGKRFEQIENDLIIQIIDKCQKIKGLIDGEEPLEDKISELAKLIQFNNLEKLISEIEKRGVGDAAAAVVEHQEEEEAELDELEVRKMSAVELLTIVGSKGLSADHVILIGFDETNMSYISRKAFYVAMTRARRSLHIITALGSGGSKGPHHFLENMPVNSIDFYTYKKTGNTLTKLADKNNFVSYFEKVNFVRRRR